MSRTPSPPDRPRDRLEERAARKSGGILREYWEFLRYHRKWYLLPVVVALIVLGALIFAAGTSVAPFIYTMF